MVLLKQFFFVGLVGFFSFLQTPDSEELELKSIHVLKGYNKIFDLSGIAQIKQNYYIVGDKQYTRQLYRVELKNQSFHILDSLSLEYNEKSDIEAVDYCENNSVYFTNELSNQAFQYSEGRLQVVFDSKQLNTVDWGSNKGLEGIAVDCANQIIYLAKEREPRFILIYDLEKQEILDISMKDSVGDISDLKFEKGFLYILERNENLVAKMDVNTLKIVSRVSYKNTCSNPRGKLYEGTKYGMGEALLLTPDEIWIGLDNNGLSFSNHASETYGLSGNSPVIIKFKRPAGF